MSSISRSRRAASGIALIVAGALFVLVVVLPLVGIALPWLVLLADLAMAVALGILGFGAVTNAVARIALIAAAVGWLVLALSPYVAFPAVLVTLAAIVAGVGGVVGAIVIYVGKEITNYPAIAFIVATVLGLLVLLIGIGTLAVGGLTTILIVLFGAALIATGILFRRTERTRRR